MTPEEYARALIASLAKHFGISTIPNVKVAALQSISASVPYRT